MHRDTTINLVSSSDSICTKSKLHFAFTSFILTLTTISIFVSSRILFCHPFLFLETCYGPTIVGHCSLPADQTGQCKMLTLACILSYSSLTNLHTNARTQFVGFSCAVNMFITELQLTKPSRPIPSVGRSPASQPARQQVELEKRMLDMLIPNSGL